MIPKLLYVDPIYDHGGIIYINIVCIFQMHDHSFKMANQLAITCSKLTIEILEEGVKYVQS